MPLKPRREPVGRDTGSAPFSTTAIPMPTLRMTMKVIDDP